MLLFCRLFWDTCHYIDFLKMRWDEKNFVRKSSSKYDKSIIQDFVMSGGLRNGEAHESNDKMSYNVYVLQCDGAFCVVVAILIILLNVCLWFLCYFSVQDSII